MPADLPDGGAVLEADGLDVLYGDYQILWDARIRVEPDEVVALLGPNGAGKSTLMNTRSGLVRAQRGNVTFRGRRIERLPPHRIVDLGLSHVLERRRLFPYLTVGQNVLLGAYPPGARARRAPRRGPRSRRCFPCSRPAGASPPTPFPEASSRWSRSRAASWPAQPF
jgi:ABC-type branched-subunit amino acid transport system ATPase component